MTVQYEPSEGQGEGLVEQGLGSGGTVGEEERGRGERGRGR